MPYLQSCQERQEERWREGAELYSGFAKRRRERWKIKEHSLILWLKHYCLMETVIKFNADYFFLALSHHLNIFDDNVMKASIMHSRCNTLLDVCQGWHM